MGIAEPHSKVMLIVAACSRFHDALQWARRTTQQAWGPIALSSDVFDFDQTDYYTSTMGTGLFKTFFAFEQLIEPTRLVTAKHETNAWEQDYCRQHPHPETRPLNLDPGYISQTKLVLASTKDHCHRIYLDRGIYAEITLYYQQRQWRRREWTYPDYQSEGYHRFFTQCRDYVRARREK